VRDGDDGACREVFPNDPLNHGIGLGVHRGSGFIHEEYPTAFQHHPTQTKQLALPHTPVLTIVDN
jgi:hypothetical protein